MEAWLQDRCISFDEFFLILQRQRDSECAIEDTDGFVTRFLLLVNDYPEFEQMALQADILKCKDAVGTTAMSENNLTGVWAADPDKIDPPALERFMAKKQVPMLFRPIFRRAARFIKKIVIHQTDETFTARYKLAVLGSRTDGPYTYGVTYAERNLWGAKRQVTFFLDDLGRASESWTVGKQFPAGTTLSVFNHATDNGQGFAMINCLEIPGEEPVIYTQYFKRDVSG